VTGFTPEAAIIAMWVAWWILWLAAAAWSDRAVKAPPIHYHLLYRFIPAVGAVLLFGAIRRGSGEVSLWHLSDAIAWAMALVALLGFLFTWWARFTLGRLWSSSVSRKADHYIVETGPYRLVRHPIYTGIILAAVATAIERGTLEAWLGAAIMTSGWYVKARLEERFLREELGAQAYDEYARRVPMLLPFS
jgi:protein-S-isoprenylcysteine O-methyltransferase Ste14